MIELSTYDIAYACNHIIDTLVDGLSLFKIQGPLLVRSDEHINDMLSSEGKGPVTFIGGGDMVEVVQSLAKWKRLAIAELGLEPEHGIYTDMHAIRQDEELDTTHSYHVEQIDWEVRITKNDRQMGYLTRTVIEMYEVIRHIEDGIHRMYGIGPSLPESIFFITKAELDILYPSLPWKEKEHAITRIHKAVCITCIPGPDRSWEYDDWDLNCDIILWSDRLGQSVEITSMGIRVDAQSLQKQAKMANATIPSSLYHDGIIGGSLPLTIGGGIGKARLCMILLNMGDIREVYPLI